MSRPDGFPVADVDVRLLSDPRVIRAVRAVGPDAVVAYIAVVTASWADGERLPAREALDALPRVYLADPVAVLAALVEAGLLDVDERIPPTTWRTWYGPAADRRQARRDSSAAGGEATRRRWSKADGIADGIADGRPKARPKAGRDRAPTDRPTARPSGRSGASAPAPAPAREADPDDPYGSTVAVAPPDATATVYCLDYAAHRSSHRRAYRGGPFVCDVCGPAPPTSTFREMVAAHGGPAR